MIHDVSTGDHRVIDANLGDLAVCDLAVRDGVVFAGTWIYGGSGAPDPTLTEGNLFALDPDTGNILWTTKPVPGATAYAGVVVDRSGRLWAVADTTLVEVDPLTGEALRTLSVGDRVAGGRTFPNTVAILAEAPDLPALYVKSAGRLWRAWTETGTVEDLGLSGYRLFTMLPDGTMVLAQGQTLYRWQPPTDDVAPTISVDLEQRDGERLARIAIAASHTGGSGLGSVRYRLNHGGWKTYRGPIAPPRPGRHRVEVTATDGAGNAATHVETVVIRPRLP